MRLLDAAVARKERYCDKSFQIKPLVAARKAGVRLQLHPELNGGEKQVR